MCCLPCTCLFLSQSEISHTGFSLTQTNKIPASKQSLRSCCEASVWLGVSCLLFLLWVLIPRVLFVLYAQLFLCLGIVELPGIIWCLWFSLVCQTPGRPSYLARAILSPHLAVSSTIWRNECSRHPCRNLLPLPWLWDAFLSSFAGGSSQKYNTAWFYLQSRNALWWKPFSIPGWLRVSELGF